MHKMLNVSQGQTFNRVSFILNLNQREVKTLKQGIKVLQNNGWSHTTAADTLLVSKLKQRHGEDAVFDIY
tara:strand:+ start:286 stop:495 length:210 start_codon:yes stop_codon:yes gene_type:complete